MVIYGDLLVTHYWLSRQMVDMFEREGWTEQLWVSAAVLPSLLYAFSLSKVHKVFPPLYSIKSKAFFFL